MHRTICHWDSRLGLELLHDVEEIVVNGGLVAKLQLHLVQVRQGILHLQPHPHHHHQHFRSVGKFGVLHKGIHW